MTSENAAVAAATDRTETRVFRRPREQWDSVEWWALILVGCVAASALLMILALTGALDG